MLKYRWNKVTITTNKAANDMFRLFNEIKPIVGAFDTETDGLHIISSKPFLFQFGFLHPTENIGYTYAVDLEKQPQLARDVIKVWHELAKTLKIYLGHNIKYDLHMLTNIDLSYTTENLSDTMFYIRYAHDALTAANGGPPLGLKDYTSRYIDPSAKYHEKLLANERSAIAKDLNIRLKYRLAKCGEPPEKYGAKSYTLSVISKIFKDPTVDYNDIPEEIKSEYLDWLRHDVPIVIQNKVQGIVTSDLIPYNKLNRSVLLDYAHFDIVYTLEIYALLAPVVKGRGNEVGLNFENSLILPLWEMERVGFAVDINYIKDCRIKMKNYIKERRQELYDLAGTELAIGQHALIKSILDGEYDVVLPSTNSAVMDTVKSELIREGTKEEAVKFIDIVQELRTLEKWYSVYIMRFIRDLQNADKLYTTINQVGTVSGRVTSDFQQFPKDAIKTVKGEELFSPRRMVRPTGGGYNAIIYLDYSQIELRFQALYTILVGHPDLNLCRAYMPYKCVDSNGNPFDHTNINHIKNWAGDWYYEENPSERWIATDVHGATTEKATGLTKDHPDFAKLRSKIGKRVNFAKNYGAQYKKIREMFPNETEEAVRRIDNAYYEAFPGVKEYHTYCYERATAYASTTNLFNVKYYGVSGHKLINMLIQGGSAYYLKWKIRQLYEYSKARGIKTRWQMQIHDELSWEYHIDDDPSVFFDFKRIMEDWSDTLVPVVADMECTTTTWAEKREVETVEELQSYISP